MGPAGIKSEGEIKLPIAQARNQGLRGEPALRWRITALFLPGYTIVENFNQTLFNYFYHPSISVHIHSLAVLENFCDILNPDNTRLPHLTGNGGSVLEHAATFEQNAARVDKERCPARLRGIGYQDVAGHDQLFIVGDRKSVV